MALNRLLDPLRLDADVALGDGGGAVLQEPLDEGDVVAVVLVDLCGVPFAEAVGADAFVAQIVTDDGELLLDRSGGHREDQVIAAYSVAQTIVFDVLLDDQRDSKDTLLACLLLSDRQAEASAVIHDVAGAEPYDVADPQAQIALQHKGGGNPLIGAAAAETRFHGGDDLAILLCGQSGGFSVHFGLQVRFCEEGKFAFLVGL